MSAATVFAVAWLCLASSWPLSWCLPEFPTPGLFFGAGWILFALRHRGVWGARRFLYFGSGAAAGWLSAPLWIVALGALQNALGWNCPAAQPVGFLASCVLAPVFEEGLYRGCLLPAWLPRWGRIRAVAATSALFAIPHLGGCAALSTFIVGLALGALQVRFASLPLCIGCHAGMNAFLEFAGELPWPRLQEVSIVA